MSYPFQASSEQARVQSFLRVSSSGNSGHDVGAKFGSIVRCSSSGVLAHLRPDILGRIEFWRRRREPVNDQALLLCQEFLNDLTLVDGMIIPDEDNVAGGTAQQLFEKSDHFLASQAMPVRAYAQFELFSAGQDQHSTDDIETIMMANTGADDRRFATRRPSAFERRNQ